MVVHRLPLLMGGAMGLAMPWMMHMGEGQIGLVFILAHVAVILAIATLALVFPAIRHRASRLTSHASHAPWMVLGLAVGWGMICAYCLVIGGQHWT